MAVMRSQLRLSLYDGVSAKMRALTGTMARFQAGQRAMMAPFAGGLAQVAAVTGAYIGATAGIRGTVGAAMEFESAFADVRKVIDGSPEQMDNLRRSITEMSKDIPIAASGIASIYAAAGQANIPRAELDRFAEMVAKVSVAWEVPVAETGQALAEIKNQLNLGVAEVGLFADAVNHLGNNSAAAAPKLLDYTKRVAATGEMFGFSREQTLAFGGAMIAAGGEANVAATSFRNMGRALTMGEEATAAQRGALEALGLSAERTAKDMQKDALGTTLEVLEKIQELPEWQRISVAGALFGQEARALMPVINNATELRRQLRLVGDEADYAGSAFDEYVIRADTVGNVLQLLRNRIADVFRGIGDDMLPGLKSAALGISDIVDSLGERAHIFSQMQTAVEGFMQGLGGDSDIRALMNDIGDFLLGPADGAEGAERLGRIFRRFEEWGGAVRDLNAAITASPLTDFLGTLSGYGFKLMLAAVGFSMLAGALWRVARALAFLTGFTTAVGIIRTLGSAGLQIFRSSAAVGKVADDVARARPVVGGRPGRPGASGPWGRVPHTPEGMKVTPTGPRIAPPGAPPATETVLQRLSKMLTPKTLFQGLKGFGLYLGGEYAIRKGVEATTGRDFVMPPGLIETIGRTVRSYLDLLPSAQPDKPSAFDQDAPFPDTNVLSPAEKKLEPIDLSAASVSELLQPTATQDVRVTNRPPPPSISNSITINGVSGDLEAIARAAGEAAGRASREAVESMYSDGVA